jgi:hypothetical protein
MAITDINISEQLQTDAPSIKYTGNEGPQASPQHQQEQMIARQIWDALGPEQQGQFQSFEQFFQSGIWKQILQQMQQDEGQGPGPEQQGIGSLGPQPMEQQRSMPRMGAELGGRIGFQQGGDPEVMKKVKFYVEVMGMSPEEALQRVISQSEGSFPRPELEPAELRPEFRPNYQEPLRPRGLGMRPPEEVEDFREEQVGIETLRGRR